MSDDDDARRPAKQVKFRQKVKRFEAKGEQATASYGPNPLHGKLLRSSLVSELYELLAEDVEEGATCVRSLSGGGGDDAVSWEAADQAVESYLASKGLYGEAVGVEAAVIDASNDGGVAKLRGERGVLATAHLAAGVCVGQYLGDESLDFEFERTYPFDGAKNLKSDPTNRRWSYAMHVGFDRGRRDRRISRFTSRKRDPFLKRKGKIPDDVVVTVSSDPTDPASPVVLANDCRADMSKATMSAEDERRRNADFLYCAVGGALFPFLVTTRPVDEGDQIFAYYGRHFILPPDDGGKGKQHGGELR